MGPLLLPMALFAVAASPPPAPEQPRVGATFETNKGLGELEKCLTDKLSQRGDVTAMQSDTSTTLMLRWGGEAPMLIELTPPKVTVTTRFASGTRWLVEQCL
jgi:hypothetical protein